MQSIRQRCHRNVCLRSHTCQLRCFLDAFNRTFGLKGVRVYVRTEVLDAPDRIENCIILSFIGLQYAEKVTHGVGALWESPGFLFAGNPRGYAASVLSLVTNLLATSLIGYRAW